MIRLERNYRSTGHILATAAHLIAKNEGRLGKTLFTDGEDGEKTTVTGVWESEEEARTIGETIEQLQHKSHLLEEIAILCRASFQMREFEERFITLGLPYRVIGGPRFYERAEIRDALALPALRRAAAGRPRVRAHLQQPEARAGRCHPAAAARPRAARAHPLDDLGAADDRDRGAEAQTAPDLACVARRFFALGVAHRYEAAGSARRADPGGIRLHRDVAEGPDRRGGRAAGEPEGARPGDGGVPRPSPPSWSTSRW